MGVPICLINFRSTFLKKDLAAVSTQNSVHSRSWYEFHATVVERDAIESARGTAPIKISVTCAIFNWLTAGDLLRLPYALNPLEIMKTAFVLLGVALAALKATGSPSVKVSLRSSWPSSPLLAEILYVYLGKYVHLLSDYIFRETVALEKPHAFFKFLDRLTDTKALMSMTPKDIHKAALQIALDDGILEETGSLPAVEMNLALHAATPKLEAFYNHYEDHHNNSRGTQCGSWVDWYGEVVCDANRLAELAEVETNPPSDLKSYVSFFCRLPPFYYTHALESISSAQTRPQILTFDHISPPPHLIVDRPPRTAILYASLTSPNFRELHTYLLRIVNQLNPHVEYVFRHIPPTTRSNGRSYLSGYGVALDIKKMDYLALDDRHSSSGGRSLIIIPFYAINDLF